jgi:serine/threonine-protein kinase HipA
MQELNREAQILVNGRLAGILSEYKNCKSVHIIFQYEEDYISSGSPIGYYFPLTTAPFEWNELPPFFENLASEGWLRKVQCEKYDIAHEDTFGLLLANGKELIGALSITPHVRDN